MPRSVEQFSALEVHGQKFSFSPLAKISDEQLIHAINSDGVQKTFKIEDINQTKTPPYQEIADPQTGGVMWIRRQELKARDGNSYNIEFAADLDNRSVAIEKRTAVGDLKVLRLNLRDRSHDGTPESTPPNFLDLKNVPHRSGLLGGTLWYYANPEVDRQLPGRSSVEISRVSSDPEKLIFDGLARKRSLTIAEEIARFIDDPFAALPFNNPSYDELSYWYKLWWSVIDRGLGGERLAYPGQTSEQGFKNFSPHVLQKLPQLLEPFKYTHISSVPTWLYVWKANINGSGFHPDNIDQHNEALDFLERLKNINLPFYINNTKVSKRARELSEKDPLISWLAVAPFALQLDSKLHPSVGVKEQDQFDQVFLSIKENLIGQDGKIITYPLAPRRNLWHSKKISNK